MADRATDPYLSRPIPGGSPEVVDIIKRIRREYEQRVYGSDSQAQPEPSVAPQDPEPQQAAEIPRIKRNVKRLMEQNAPEEDIDGYIASEGVTLDQLKAHKQDAPLSWADVPGRALSNVPESAARTAQALIYPIMHPVDSVVALGNMANGAMWKVAGAAGIEQDPQDKARNEAQLDAVGAFFKSRYGSLDALKKTLAEDPVGVAADLATVLSGGGAAAARAPGVVGRAGQAVAKAGRAIDPLAGAGRLAKGAGKTVAAVSGMASGVGSAPVEAAFNAGRTGSKAFTENMRGQAPITDTLDMAQSAMSKIRDERRAAYENGMLSVDVSFKKLDFKPISKAIETSGEKVYFKGVAKSAEAAETLKQITDKFEEFAAIDDSLKQTPKGVDALKQMIGEIRMGTKQGTLSRKVADHVYNAIKNQIVKQVPDYADTMRGYAQASDQLDDLGKTFSLGENAAKDTAIRKLTSVMRNNVNTNYGRRTQLMDVLAAKEPDLPYAIAGQAMSSLTPRGLGGQLTASSAGLAGYYLANPLAIPALAAASPRIVGEAAHAAGKVSGAAETIGKALKIDPKLVARVMRASYAINQGAQPALVGEQDYGADTPEELKRLRR